MINIQFNDTNDRKSYNLRINENLLTIYGEVKQGGRINLVENRVRVSLELYSGALNELKSRGGVYISSGGLIIKTNEDSIGQLGKGGYLELFEVEILKLIKNGLTSL